MFMDIVVLSCSMMILTITVMLISPVCLMHSNNDEEKQLLVLVQLYFSYLFNKSSAKQLEDGFYSPNRTLKQVSVTKCQSSFRYSESVFKRRSFPSGQQRLVK